jgi:malate synthase
MIDDQILKMFPELFGTKRVNGRDVDVEETISSLAVELETEIAHALNARRELLESPLDVGKKYSWPGWNDTFEDPVSGGSWTFRQIVQGMIDNFLNRDSRWRWRLNDDCPIPEKANPLMNPGLELTGPWNPPDMAFNALNCDVLQNMPDFEDASPPHFRPCNSSPNEPIGVYSAIKNAMDILAGRWNGEVYEVVKKGKVRRYRIDKASSQWPTLFVRPPGIHVRYNHITVDGKPVSGLIAIAVIWALNNYESLTGLGSGVYFYMPKIQTPREALIVERLLSGLEGIMGIPLGSMKIKVLYEEGNAGRYFPAIAWTFRRRLLGTNVGRWDYLGSLIEMWKDDPNGLFPDPQSVSMASSNMIAYQRYNAMMMLMAGMNNNELTNGAPIGGMAAVMVYQDGDPYGRSRYNPIALRAMVIDKLRERLIGLFFVPEKSPVGVQPPTLEDIIAGRVKGRLYDAYRQSWVASPDPVYVAAGNRPLQTETGELQSIIDAPCDTIKVKGRQVPSVGSGLIEAERQVLQSCGLLNEQGKIIPKVISKEMIWPPEDLFCDGLWSSIYQVPVGEITAERIQHSFYMAANYGFQILNGNFAAAIDDYELSLRFMNDLATYRINVSWLWTLVRHGAVITRDGFFKGPALTEDGVVPSVNAVEIKAGTRFTRELFEKMWTLHRDWTTAFFYEQDRRNDPGRFDRTKADVIMELLKRQLLSPRYIQHSARLLFILGQAEQGRHAEVLSAMFDLTREEIIKLIQAGALDNSILADHDYVYDIFSEI